MEIAATSTEVFDCINDVSKWWVKQVEDTTTAFEGESSNLNDVFVLRAGDRTGNNHYSKHKLIEVVPNERVVWLVTDSMLNWIKGNMEEWTGTKMIFDIIQNSESTTLIFTHEGLVPQLECYEHCLHFWDMIIKDWLLTFIIRRKTI